jgi:hypothetical protein
LLPEELPNRMLETFDCNWGATVVGGVGGVGAEVVLLFLQPLITSSRKNSLK